MELPVITNVVRTAVSGLGPNGQQWANILHFRRTSGVLDVASLPSLRDHIVSLYNVSYGAGQWQLLFGSPISVTLGQISFTPLDGTSASTVYTVSGAGTQTGDALPAEVAIVLSLRTALRGRRNRGRLYIPCLAEAVCDAVGQPTTNAVSGYAAQANTFRTTITPSGWEWVVASYGGPQPNGTRRWTPYATAISTVTCDRYFDSQRRRGLPR